jgi:hypothetical protein
MGLAEFRHRPKRFHATKTQSGHGERGIIDGNSRSQARIELGPHIWRCLPRDQTERVAEASLKIAPDFYNWISLLLKTNLATFNSDGLI